MTMRYTILVILLLLLQYLYFQFRAGLMRSKGEVAAPAISGDDRYERAYRVQMNTMENLVLVLPMMVLLGNYFNDVAAAALGLLFFAGRALYSHAYMREPKSRSTGFLIGFAATIGLLLWFLAELALHIIATA